MIMRAIRRLLRREEGMEMVEWSIVAVVFALASAFIWGTLSGNINTAITEIGTCVETGDCGDPPAPDPG